MATLDAEDLTNIVNAVWNEVLTGVTHNIKNSTGKRLRDLASNVVHTDTARGPAVNGNQIELASSASATNGAYDPSMITIIDGTGQGQTRLIYEYNGSTKIATIDRNWKVNPDDTSEYVISSHPGREHVNEGLARGGSSNTITLNSLASDGDDVYNDQIIFLRSGLGEDQVAAINAYNGTTKIATIDKNWNVIPDNTTGYVMLPAHIDYQHVTNAVWNAPRSEHTESNSFGEGVQNILGLLHQNSIVDNTVYDVNGILTSARIRVFSDKDSALAATDGGSDEGEIAEFAIDGVAEVADKTKMATHRLVKV